MTGYGTSIVEVAQRTRGDPLQRPSGATDRGLRRSIGCRTSLV